MLSARSRFGRVMPRGPARLDSFPPQRKTPMWQRPAGYPAARLGRVITAHLMYMQVFSHHHPYPPNPISSASATEYSTPAPLPSST